MRVDLLRMLIVVNKAQQSACKVCSQSRISLCARCIDGIALSIELTELLGLSGKLIGSLHIHASHTWLHTALVVQCVVIAYAKSASAAAVTRYQASLRSPHNALHSPSWGERSEAPHGRYI